MIQVRQHQITIYFVSHPRSDGNKIYEYLTTDVRRNDVVPRVDVTNIEEIYVLLMTMELK